MRLSAGPVLAVTALACALAASSGGTARASSPPSLPTTPLGRPPPKLEPKAPPPPPGQTPTGYDLVKAKARAAAISAHLAKTGAAGYSHAELRGWQLQAGLPADGLYGGSSRGALIYFGVKTPPQPFFKPTATIKYVPKGAAAAPAARALTVAPAPKPAAAVPVKTPAQVAKAKLPAAVPVKAPIKKPLGKVVAQNAAQKQAPAATPAGGSVRASPELEPNHGSPPIGYDAKKAASRARALAAHLAKKGPASYSRPELKSWQLQAGLKPDGLYGGSSRGALIYFGVKDPPRPFAKPVATLQYVPPEQRK